jgi:hypothetical protein
MRHSIIRRRDGRNAKSGSMGRVLAQHFSDWQRQRGARPPPTRRAGGPLLIVRKDGFTELTQVP